MKYPELIDISLTYAATFLFLQGMELETPCDLLADLVSDMDWNLEEDGQPGDLTIWLKYKQDVADSLGIEHPPPSVSDVQAAQVIPIFLRSDYRYSKSKTIAQIATNLSEELNNPSLERKMFERWLVSIQTAIELPASYD